MSELGATLFRLTEFIESTTAVRADIEVERLHTRLDAVELMLQLNREMIYSLLNPTSSIGASDMRSSIAIDRERDK